MENNLRHKVIGACATICRFILAVVFIFSGFVKAIDPLGTQYKIQDYLDAFGWANLLPDVFPLIVSLVIGWFEFCLGVYLFFGIRRRLAPRTMVVVMSLMTPLTLWLAITNPVSDCGCFGEAVVLSNWETFAKNVILLLMAIFLLVHRRRIFPLVTVRLDWLIALYSSVYIFCIIVYCYQNLPLFDFRPYHIGADIKAGMTIPEGEKPMEFETRFILKKNGEKKEFTLENYPDSTWTFVDSRTVVKKAGYEPPVQDFTIINLEDGEDLTDRILSDENYSFLMVAHQLQQADDSTFDLINDLYDYCLTHGYGFYCLTSSSEEDIHTWIENTGAEYPFATMDDITLKTIVRSNPGLLLLKKGVVINKWSANNWPDEHELSGTLEDLPIGKLDIPSLLNQMLVVIAWFVFPLFFMCMFDLYWEKYKKRNCTSSDEFNL